MNFQNLEYFVETAKALNITKAAEQLHISQQALSNHIIKLEEELGCRLFERRRGLQLTYSGKQLYKSAEQILDIRSSLGIECKFFGRVVSGTHLFRVHTQLF